MSCSAHRHHLHLADEGSEDQKARDLAKIRVGNSRHKRKHLFNTIITETFATMLKRFNCSEFYSYRVNISA